MTIKEHVNELRGTGHIPSAWSVPRLLPICKINNGLASASPLERRFIRFVLANAVGLAAHFQGCKQRGGGIFFLRSLCVMQWLAGKTQRWRAGGSGAETSSSRGRFFGGDSRRPGATSVSLKNNGQADASGMSNFMVGCVSIVVLSCGLFPSLFASGQPPPPSEFSIFLHLNTTQAGLLPDFARTFTHIHMCIRTTAFSIFARVSLLLSD